MGKCLLSWSNFVDKWRSEHLEAERCAFTAEFNAFIFSKQSTMIIAKFSDLRKSRQVLEAKCLLTQYKAYTIILAEPVARSVPTIFKAQLVSS